MEFCCGELVEFADDRETPSGSVLPGRTTWEFRGGASGGPLLSDDGATRLGTAGLLRAPDPDKARAVLTAERYADVEVHAREIGGRRR
ncbi:hypothetical protein AB0N07_07560 [Streptomyces sp. NPDC051172]|uniref:hypothetical protein n=1 Tax=Streptomyces sp. NPDC051172 TaxID=3155796 RepID=UPI0034206E3E